MVYQFFGSMHDRPGDKQTPDIKDSVSIFKILSISHRPPKWFLLKGNSLRISVQRYSFVFWIDSNWIPVLTLRFFYFSSFFINVLLQRNGVYFRQISFSLKEHQSRTVPSTVRKIIPDIDLWTEYLFTFYCSFLLRNICLELHLCA